MVESGISHGARRGEARPGILVTIVRGTEGVRGKMVKQKLYSFRKFLCSFFSLWARSST